MELAVAGFVLTILTAAISLVSRYHAQMNEIKTSLVARIDSLEKEVMGNDSERLIRQTEVKAVLSRHDQWLSSLQSFGNNTKSEGKAMAQQLTAEHKLALRERDELIHRLFTKVANIELFLSKEFSFKIRNTDRDD